MSKSENLSQFLEGNAKNWPNLTHFNEYFKTSISRIFEIDRQWFSNFLELYGFSKADILLITSAFETLNQILPSLTLKKKTQTTPSTPNPKIQSPSKQANNPYELREKKKQIEETALIIEKKKSLIVIQTYDERFRLQVTKLLEPKNIQWPLAIQRLMHHQDGYMTFYEIIHRAHVMFKIIEEKDLSLSKFYSALDQWCHKNLPNSIQFGELRVLFELEKEVIREILGEGIACRVADNIIISTQSVKIFNEPLQKIILKNLTFWGDAWSNLIYTI